MTNKVIRYDKTIIKSYQNYLAITPLDLKENNHHLASWTKNHQYSLTTYAQKIAILCKCKNLDSFIKKSESDFDNLGPLIESSIQSGFVQISENGTVTRLIHVASTPKKMARLPRCLPNNEYNQFPCDPESSARRVEFIKSRYPFCNHLKIGIIGEDDFISYPLSKNKMFSSVIIEIDKNIIQKIKRCSTDSKIIQEDVCKLAKSGQIKEKVQTFIIDPPYTFHGALAFTITGLKMLESNQEEKEFYIILNRSMMGKSFFRLQKLLASADVHLYDSTPNFSHYKLPKHYAERERANQFLVRIGANTQSISYSSSSTLFVFKTYKPNIEILKKSLDVSKIYEHY